MEDAASWGLNAVERVELGPMSVTVALDSGPRILAYSKPGCRQLFACLPSEDLFHPWLGRYRFLGGHRLWRAPEVPAATYVPDDGAVVVEAGSRHLSVTGRPDPDGLVKKIVLTQAGDDTVVDHVLRNAGDATLRLAPWAITQLMPGGTAILPQPAIPSGDDALQPHRQLVLWSYSDPASPDVEVGQSEIAVNASADPEPFKIGQPNQRGWLAYRLGDTAFVKWGPVHDASASYVDMGASAQVYRNARFIELETLGPVVDLAPGGESRHREVWRLLSLDGSPWRDVVRSLEAVPEAMKQ